MNKPKFIAIKNQADNNSIELYLLDVIADSYDFWSGATSSKVQEIINQVNSYHPSTVKVVIDSVGGDAFVGTAIYNYLKNLNAEIEVEIIGLAASVASVVSMAASPGKLRIAKNGFMMLHKAQGVTGGTADEIRQGADLVSMVDQQIADIYSQRTGKAANDITALYANGDYWMTGEQAVQQGFADETFNQVQNISVAARLNEDDYKNMPAAIRAQLTPEDHKSFFQNQFDDMKKVFMDVINSIKGIKPADNTDKQEILNQIAVAMAPLENIEAEIETTINNRVAEEIKGEAFTNAVNAAVTAQMVTVNEKVAAMEQDIVNKLGQPHATGVTNNATANPIPQGQFSNE